MRLKNKDVGMKKSAARNQSNESVPMELVFKMGSLSVIITAAPLNFCPLSFVLCPLSFVLCPLSFVLCPILLVNLISSSQNTSSRTNQALFLYSPYLQPFEMCCLRVDVRLLLRCFIITSMERVSAGSSSQGCSMNPAFNSNPS